MKSLMLLWKRVLEDFEYLVSRESTIRDFKTASDRFEHEGRSFLTITLTNFGRDLETGLRQGFVDSSLFTGFRFGGGLPRFLGGFLCRVFDRRTGRLLDEPCLDAIIAVRQLTLMFGKIELECSKERIEAAKRRYIECEQDVRDADASLEPARLQSFLRVSHLLFGRVLQNVNLDVQEGKLIPKHGPGATADRLRGNAKWTQQEWTERLEKVFPHWEYLVPGWSLYDRLSNVRILEPGAERPVKVVMVPKTLKTPRVIAEEPTCMQYMQQAILRALVDRIEEDDFSRSVISWQSAERNHALARQGSLDGSFATLDLSEASDRVSNQHVRTLLKYHPPLAEAVDATRSRKADLDGRIIRLAKFASMGSALCFPMEAMVFATVVFMGIERGLSRPLTRRDLKSLMGSVRVYGDDIIVPTDHALRVVAELEAFGFRVNASKSFWTGKFRESCGQEYYGGEDVTITRIRSPLPTRRADVPEIASTVAARNLLYKDGLWGSSAYLTDYLETRLNISLPIVSESSPALGRTSIWRYDYYRNLRMCPRLHRPLVRALVTSHRSPVSRLDDYGALAKCLIKPREAKERNLLDMPVAQLRHLERSGRPQSSSMKLRWVTPY